MNFTDLLTREPSLPAELLVMGDHLADWLRSMDGTITDVGYDIRASRAELVVEAPDSTRIEFTLRVLS